MNKTYKQKENVYIYIALLFLMAAVYIWAVWLINYHVWAIIFAFAAIGIKTYKVYQNPELPVIKLTDTHLHCLLPKTAYEYSEIDRIHINSKLLNGYIILKENNKKVTINSVAISSEDQEEIRDFVNSKIV